MRRSSYSRIVALRIALVGWITSSSRKVADRSPRLILRTEATLSRMTARSPLITLIAAVSMASSALLGCTERFDGFTVESPGVRSDIRIVPMAPRRYDELRFEVSPKRYEGASGSVSPRVDGAILKIEGFLPLRADVSESDGGYVVTFHLPKEGLSAFHVRRAQAQLHLPTDIGQLAWTGLEHRTPGAISESYTLVPQQSGPVTSALREFFEMLRGLYAAR